MRGWRPVKSCFKAISCSPPCPVEACHGTVSMDSQVLKRYGVFCLTPQGVAADSELQLQFTVAEAWNGLPRTKVSQSPSILQILLFRCEGGQRSWQPFLLCCLGQ